MSEMKHEREQDFKLIDINKASIDSIEMEVGLLKVQILGFES